MWRDELLKRLPKTKGFCGFSPYQEGHTDGWNAHEVEVRKVIEGMELEVDEGKIRKIIDDSKAGDTLQKHYLFKGKNGGHDEEMYNAEIKDLAHAIATCKGLVRVSPPCP